MYFLVAGALIFFAVHFYSAIRTRVSGLDVREKLGAARFMGVYSLISLIGFVLMVWGYYLARPSPQLFETFSWAPHITWALMLPAFILLTAAYSPNGYIKEYSRHPMLLATILWSFGHLMANGELNSVILFGGFLAFAIIDRISVAGRPRPVKKVSITGDIIAVIIGIGVYWLTLRHLHGAFIGVSLT